MTWFQTKSERDILGIDSFERALVYAAIGLRQVVTLDLEPHISQKNAYADAVKINIVNRTVNLQTSPKFEDELATINIQAQFPYDRQEALGCGGDFFRGVKIISNEIYSLYLRDGALLPSQPNNLAFSMPEEPAWAQYYLERFFVWVAKEILRHYYELGLWKEDYLKDLYSVKISLSDSNALGGVIQLDVTLPIYYLLYLQTGNLLASVHTIIAQNIS